MLLKNRIIILGIVIWLGGFYMIRMPGKSYQGPLPPLTEYETFLQQTLRQDIEKLSGEKRSSPRKISL